MLSTKFALIISKEIKKIFGLDCVVTNDKALILVSSYPEDKLYKTDTVIIKSIKCKSEEEQQTNDVNETIIPIKADEDIIDGFVHIKSNIDTDTINTITQLINSLYRYETLRTELDNEYNDNEKIIQNILTDITPEISKNIESLAAKLNYDIKHPMAAVVARIEENRYSYLNMDLGYSSAIKATKEQIITEIRSHFCFNNRDIVAFTNEGFLVVLKAFYSMDDLTSLYTALRKCVEQIDRILNKYKIFNYIVSNGHIVENYFIVYSSFKEALRNIEISHTLGFNSSIVFPEDILFEKLIDTFSIELIEMQIMPLIKKIDKAGIEKSSHLLTLFEQYCSCDFNISETATRSYLHRNTVAQKLDKLKEITGLNPMGGFKDRLLLRLLCSYMKMNNPGLR